MEAAIFLLDTFDWLIYSLSIIGYKALMWKMHAPPKMFLMMRAEGKLKNNNIDIENKSCGKSDDQ